MPYVTLPSIRCYFATVRRNYCASTIYIILDIVISAGIPHRAVNDIICSNGCYRCSPTISRMQVAQCFIIFDLFRVPVQAGNLIYLKTRLIIPMDFNGLVY